MCVFDLSDRSLWISRDYENKLEAGSHYFVLKGRLKWTSKSLEEGTFAAWQESILNVRIFAQFLIMLCGCAAICSLLGSFEDSRPTVIAGTVINVINHRPVPYAKIRFRELNGSREAATADELGRFSVRVEYAGNCYSLYVAPPDSGQLLGVLFTVPTCVVRMGERHMGLTVPAIPETKLTGHVYDDHNQPMSGCEVLALRYAPVNGQKLRTAGWTKTDETGAFQFTNLGADRLLVFARCREYAPGEPRDYGKRRGLASMISPQIVLHPGEQVDGIDFHLRTVPQYSLEGSVTLADGSRPEKTRTYLHDLYAISTDPGMAESDIREPCDWRVADEHFHCEFLAAGTYRLHFELSEDSKNPKEFRNEEAALDVQVGPKGSPAGAIQVGLKEVPRIAVTPQHPDDPSTIGTLRIKHACPEKMADAWIGIDAFDSGGQMNGNQNERILPCSRPSLWKLPAGHYKLFALVPGTDHELLKFEEAYSQPITIRARSSAEIELKVWTPEELLNLALKSLQ